jgi:23S rRNA pseudouridine1911/1915/1917 synthase
LRIKEPEILYEDDDVIVIDKPSGLLSVSAPGSKEETLFHMVSMYMKEEDGPQSKAFVVHRLDRDTSGVMCFAKSYRVKEDLQELFEIGKARRFYEAVVSPSPKEKSGKLITYLKEDRFGNVFVSDERDHFAKRAITLYKVVHDHHNIADVEIEILTGKKNQIRISFMQIGSPIMGDRKYGGAKCQRLMLNAARLDLSAYNDRKDYVFKSHISLF